MNKCSKKFKNKIIIIINKNSENVQKIDKNKIKNKKAPWLLVHHYNEIR